MACIACSGVIVNIMYAEVQTFTKVFANFCKFLHHFVIHVQFSARPMAATHFPCCWSINICLLLTLQVLLVSC